MGIGNIERVLGTALTATEADKLLAARFIPEVRKSLREFYSFANGFLAFHRALHVFPLQSDLVPSVWEWNKEAVWHAGYELTHSQYWFFAQDLFGDQFSLSPAGEVTRFHIETARFEVVAQSLDAWRTEVWSDPDLMVGAGFAEKWSRSYGPLDMDKRLAPKIPFFLGGAYTFDNLYPTNLLRERLWFNAELWKKTRDLPDGTAVELIPYPPDVE